MRRIVFLCLVSAFLLTQGGEARVATWRFKPSVIKIGEEQTVLEIEILEGSASSMVVELNSSNILSLHGITRKEVELFDNGLNGDNVAGDNVYTLSQISLKDWPAKDDSNCYFFNENLAHFIVGRVMVDGKPLFIHQPKIGIIKNDYLSPSVRVVVDSALQLTQNLVNVQTKKNLYASYFRWYDNGFDKELFDKIVRLTQERVGQNYDFLVFFSPTNNLEADNKRLNDLRGRHTFYHQNVLGIGLDDYERDDTFGRKLKSLICLSPGYFNGHTLTHEIFHQWCNYTLFEEAKPHWPDWSSVGGILGGSCWQEKEDVFIATGFKRYYVPKVSGLELYLAGLCSTSEVQPVYVAENIHQDFFKPGAVIAGSFSKITVDSIIAKYGERKPGFENSQKNFKVAFVMMTDGLLSSRELSFYSEVINCYNGDGFLSVDSPHDCERNLISFSQMVDGRATLDCQLGGVQEIVFQTETSREFSLNQNYPNPFNSETTISFSLPETSQVALEVYNTQGQVVAELIKSSLAAGDHQFIWQARESPAGIYFAHLKTGGFSRVIKMVLIK